MTPAPLLATALVAAPSGFPIGPQIVSSQALVEVTLSGRSDPLFRDRTTLRTLLACAVLTAILLACLLTTTGGRFVLPLDDPYIYLHYAHQAAHGAFFQYNDGDPTTTGATSLLYLLVLVPFALVLRGTALAVGAFAIGALLLVPTARLTGRLAREWIGPWAEWPAVALLLLTGPFVWGMFSGMETALVALLAVWAVYEVGRMTTAPEDRAATTRWAIAAALLALARPESAVLLVGFLGTAALLARRALPFGALGTLLPLVGAAVPFLLNLALTGTPGSMTLASKASYLLPGTTLTTWAIKASQFFMHNLKGLLGGGEAATEAWPSAYTSLVTFAAPLVLPLLVVGLFPAIVEETRRRRAGVAWAGLALLFGTLALWAALVPINLHWSRYVVPFLPLVVLFVLAGIGRVATIFGEHDRPIRDGLVLFMLAASAPTLIFFVAMFAWNAREIATQHVAMARWIREETPPGAWVGTNDVGAIAYYGERPVLDLHGLVTRELAAAKQVGSGAVLEHLERLPAVRRPATLVLIPGWYDPGFLRLHRPARSQTLHRASIAGNPLVAYRADWSYVGVADRPGPDVLERLQGRRLADELDVADLESERRHAYALELLPGASASPVGLLTPPGGAGIAPDGARLVTAAESFDLALTPGRAAVLILRALGAVRAEVRVDGGPALPLAARPPGEEQWTEAVLEVPGSLIRSSPARIRVSAVEGAYQEGGYVSAHWWAFQ